jgi:anti-anti-sigma regulatory factor
VREWTTFSGIAFRRDGDQMTVALPEKLWASNHGDLLTPVREGIEDGVRSVTLDLADTQYVDGAAIGTLSRIDGLLREAGGSGLVLRRCSHQLMEYFTLSGLTERFVLEDCESWPRE